MEPSLFAEKQLTKEEAIKMAENKTCEGWPDEQIVKFQLFQHKLAMDFGRFHEAVEKVLKRSVYTHEFAQPELLQKEFLGDKEPPTFDEIISMIPSEKLIIAKH